MNQLKILQFETFIENNKPHKSIYIIIFITTDNHHSEFFCFIIYILIS